MRYGIRWTVSRYLHVNCNMFPDMQAVWSWPLYLEYILEQARAKQARNFYDQLNERNYELLFISAPQQARNVY